MMHPIDVQKPQDQENPTADGRSGWWALFGLLLVIALVVVLIIGLSDGVAQQAPPQIPSEVPIDPGS